jgi:hypothetical protein
MTGSDLIRGSVSFSRWGDGEWSAILGRGTANCDGQPYEPLRDSLAAVLREAPGYLLGMQGFALRRFGDEIRAWLGDVAGIEWISADIFHRDSLLDRMGPIWEAMASRSVLLVGPLHLSGLEALFPICHHVVVPASRCHDSYASWSEQAMRLAWDMDRPLVAISAGMSANLLVHQMALRVPHATAIDFGSVWEPYVGHSNRTYHAKILERIA